MPADEFRDQSHIGRRFFFSLRTLNGIKSSRIRYRIGYAADRGSPDFVRARRACRSLHMTSSANSISPAHLAHCPGARAKWWLGMQAMIGDIFLSAVGASFASIALILVATRFLFRRRPGRALALTVRWLRLPIHRVASLVVALSIVAALCFAKIPDDCGAITPNASENAAVEIIKRSRQRCTELHRYTPTGLRAISRVREWNSNEDTGVFRIPTFHHPLRTQNLPDVDTMIRRLAKRLETNSGNVDGWRMLGWSYLHTGKFSEAEQAYTTALSLDPKNAETEKALEQARASEKSGVSEKPIAGDGDVRSETVSKISSEETDASAMGKEMTDRLASRLETAPRDADGWLRLMRARTVLGQQDLAKDALQKALTAFADDKSMREFIVGAAKEMGLNTN